MPTLTPAPAPTSEVLERANAAWSTDDEPVPLPRPRLVRRHPGTAVWPASGDGRGRGLRIVVRRGDAPVRPEPAGDPGCEEAGRVAAGRRRPADDRELRRQRR